ncbi:hypothetical protein [Ignatzschineria sp. LJL83]
MKILRISLIFAGVTVLSACTVHSNLPNRMIIDADGITIDSSKNTHNNGHKKQNQSNQYFCPPGQAKKGNC